MKENFEDLIRSVLSSSSVGYILSTQRDSFGECHTIQTKKGCLIFSSSREGLLAEIETPEKKKLIIDEPEIWSISYPLKSKILFYWHVFLAHAEGNLDDRIYKPEK